MWHACCLPSWEPSRKQDFNPATYGAEFCQHCEETQAESPLENPERNTTILNPDFFHLRPYPQEPASVPDFWYTEWWHNKKSCFKPPHLLQQQQEGNARLLQQAWIRLSGVFSIFLYILEGTTDSRKRHCFFFFGPSALIYILKCIFNLYSFIKWTYYVYCSPLWHYPLCRCSWAPSMSTVGFQQVQQLQVPLLWQRTYQKQLNKQKLILLHGLRKSYSGISFVFW